jgi:hypothetical protein
VDQFLDDLFMPVLDGNIDDGLSDARSLAASMRGGGGDVKEATGDVKEATGDVKEATGDVKEATAADRQLDLNRMGSIRRTSILLQVLRPAQLREVLSQVGPDSPE